VAEPLIPEKAKFFTGILYKDSADLSSVEEQLNHNFGPSDLRSGPILFDNTEYYREIGEPLYKVLLSFERLVDRGEIAAIKLLTNSLEDIHSTEGQRRVNIDPGYMTLANVFLASCKDFYHRVYLQKGVYLENEYHYSGKQFRFWPWTYPDYKKTEYLEFFYEMRRIYYRQVR